MADDTTTLPYVTARLLELYASLNVAPTGRGTGATDIAYYADDIVATGGWVGGNIDYWIIKIKADVERSNVPLITPLPTAGVVVQPPASTVASKADIDHLTALVMARIDKLESDAQAFLKHLAPYFPQVKS